MNRNRAFIVRRQQGCDAYVAMLDSACELDCVVGDRAGEDLLETVALLLVNGLVLPPTAIAVDDASRLPGTLAARGY
jgi:hypothetical protein